MDAGVRIHGIFDVRIRSKYNRNHSWSDSSCAGHFGLSLIRRTGQPSFIEYFNLATLPNGTDLLSATNGVFQTGGALGTLTLPLFADRWGRKWGLAIV